MSSIDGKISFSASNQKLEFLNLKNYPANINTHMQKAG